MSPSVPDRGREDRPHPHDTPHLLLDVEAIRAVEADHADLLETGVLMARAARAVADAALRLCAPAAPVAPPGPRAPSGPILVLVGPGNNGADALLAADLLAEAGCTVDVLLATPADQGSPPRARWLAHWRERVSRSPAARLDDVVDLAPTALARRIDGATLIIDGLFGIGSRRPLAGPIARLIHCVNTRAADPETGHRAPLLAIDLPSGLDADSGAVLGPAMLADLTVTMIADKPGLHTGAGTDHAGRVEVAPLGLVWSPEAITGAGKATPHSSAPGTRPGCGRLLVHCPAPGFAARARDSHKGSFGHLLVIGGAEGMQGAALLAAGGAQALGIGKLEIMGPDGLVFDPTQAQWMTRPWGRSQPRPDAVVIGCGLGRSPRTAQALSLWLACGLPTVLDADALAALAGEPRLWERLRSHPGPCVLTPHPLEAARLLGCPTATIQADRVGSARVLARLSGATVVLKGAGSVIAEAPTPSATRSGAPEHPATAATSHTGILDPTGPTGPSDWSINATGGPILAAAGSGDVLAGMIGALLAQGLSGPAAARLGVWTHGRAGDRAARELPRSIGLRAAELPVWVRQVANLD